MELITFAAISLSIIVLVMIMVALFMCLVDEGKRSIERYVLTLNLEFYSQVTWGALILVPALDTVFSLTLLSRCLVCLVNHLVSCRKHP